MASLQQQLAHMMFHRRFGASIDASYPIWRTIDAEDGRPLAVLGLREAAAEPLFLECYLPRAIETMVGETLGTPIARGEIVEIGCLAAIDRRAMLDLWRSCAISLAASHRVAVATLTRSLRGMLERAGVPLVELGVADRRLAPPESGAWGSYYDEQPTVCAGLVDAGREALANTASRRRSAA